MDKKDTIIKNGDTSYQSPQVVEKEDPSDINRMRELIFTVTEDNAILIDKNIYPRRKARQ